MKCSEPIRASSKIGAGTILVAASFARIPTREDGDARPHPFDNLGALPGPVRHASDPVLGEKEAPGHLGSGMVVLCGPRLPSHRAPLAGAPLPGPSSAVKRITRGRWWELFGEP